MKSQKDIYVFMGPPGSGKGSLSSLCVQKYNWIQLSTGNLCRRHISDQTDIGKEIAFAINSGKLISDSLITKMVESWLEEQPDRVSAVILDGFPRSVAQAEAFDKALQGKFNGAKLHIVNFVATDDLVVNRLSCRLVCKTSDCQAVYSTASDSVFKPKKEMECDKCAGGLGYRQDDDINAVKERLVIYHKHAYELLSYYKSNGRLVHELNAAAPVTQVFEDFKNLVGLATVSAQ